MGAISSFYISPCFTVIFWLSLSALRTSASVISAGVEAAGLAMHAVAACAHANRGIVTAIASNSTSDPRQLQKTPITRPNAVSGKSDFKSQSAGCNETAAPFVCGGAYCDKPNRLD